jgi:hypothetical protein
MTKNIMPIVMLLFQDESGLDIFGKIGSYR